jgi:hypothetical protein
MTTKKSCLVDLSAANLSGEIVNFLKFSKVLLFVNFSTSDEDLDRNFLELKELKLKFQNGMNII